MIPRRSRGSLLSRICSALPPLRGELLWGVPMGAPAHPVMRAAWQIHPRVADTLRALRALPRFIADRIRLVRLIANANDFAISRPV